MVSPDLLTTAARIADDDEARRALQRRTLIVVVVSQLFGGAGLAAGVTVGALLAQEMLGNDSVSGLPIALFTLGSALAAFLVGQITQRYGRRLGLGLGFAAGSAGAIGVVLAAASSNIPLLVAAFFVYGAGTATNLQARYAGTDLAVPTQRGLAISVAMVSTTLGAVVGPNLVGPTGDFAAGLGLPALSGPFLLSGVAYLAAGSVMVALLRPDPFLIARQLPSSTVQPSTRLLTTPARTPGAGVLVGATIMVLTQVAMVAIMTMTPVHMRHSGHSLDEVGLVIGIHIGSMFLPSLITGVLVDRIGRVPMAIASGITLLVAGVTAATAPADSLGLLILALALLGVGWNFGFISGTALLVDATGVDNRARIQGNVDVLIALTGAGGGALSGVVMASASYAALSLGGGILSLLLIPVLFMTRPRQGAKES